MRNVYWSESHDCYLVRGDDGKMFGFSPVRSVGEDKEEVKANFQKDSISEEVGYLPWTEELPEDLEEV